jgi:GDP-mannose 4,6 dehydratase
VVPECQFRQMKFCYEKAAGHRFKRSHRKRSCGLLQCFNEQGWQIHGIDNNMRKDFFGSQGDTSWNRDRLESLLKHFSYYEVDIRNRGHLLNTVAEIQPDAIIHTAAQPSHDLAASRPFDDFDVNAVGTLNLLEAVRRACPESPFVQLRLFIRAEKILGTRCSGDRSKFMKALESTVIDAPSAAINSLYLRTKPALGLTRVGSVLLFEVYELSVPLRR